MKVTFTDVAGQGLDWDGLLWSGPEGELLAKLNATVLDLPPNADEESITRHVTEWLAQHGVPGAMAEVMDAVGWPENGLAGRPNMAIESPHDGSTERGSESSSSAPARADGRRGLRSGKEIARCGKERLVRARDFIAQACKAVDEWDRPEVEWATLIQWAKNQDLVLSIAGPEIDETREHGTRYEMERDIWWKFTKPSLAGYTVDWTDRGTPFMYNA